MWDTYETVLGNPAKGLQGFEEQRIISTKNITLLVVDGFNNYVYIIDDYISQS